VPTRDINDVFRSLVEDERFKDAGLARGRGIVDNVLVYEIRITDFEFDAGMLAELQDLADREDLILNVENGNATLRQRPRDES
jgi:hypothetical protein